MLHAASVGEYNAVSPLIKVLLKAYPNLPLTITTLTPTGSERVSRDLGEEVFHCYIPLDLPCAVNRFFSQTDPRLIIVMETEIWPNLYLQAHDRKIPLMMVNARMSENSVRHYQRFFRLAKEVLQPVAWVGAQSREGCQALDLLWR